MRYKKMQKQSTTQQQNNYTGEDVHYPNFDKPSLNNHNAPKIANKMDISIIRKLCGDDIEYLESHGFTELDNNIAASVQSNGNRDEALKTLKQQ